MAADITRSIVHVNEALVLTAGVSGFKRASVAVDLPSIGAGAIGTATATVTGATVGDIVLGAASETALTAGLVVVGADVTAANTVKIAVVNTTAGAVDEASHTYDIIVANVV